MYRLMQLWACYPLRLASECHIISVIIVTAMITPTLTLGLYPSPHYVSGKLLLTN